MTSNKHSFPQLELLNHSFPSFPNTLHDEKINAIEKTGRFLYSETAGFLI